MFSKALLQSALCNPQRPSLDAAFSNYQLPAEIWDLILRLASGNNLARLVSFASVSRLFLQLCLDQCVKSRIVSFVNSTEVVNENPEPFYQANGNLTLLANDPQGRIYFSRGKEEEQILLIFNPEIGEESLEIKILAALKKAQLSKHEDLEEKRTWDRMCERTDCAEIKQCIVHTDGFVLILTYFVTYWKFNEQGLPYLCNYSRVGGTGSGDSTRYLCGTSDRHYFRLYNSGLVRQRYLSIKSKELEDEQQFNEMNRKPTTLFWHTHELSQSTYASTYTDGILSFYSVTFEDSNPRYEFITSTPEKEFETLFGVAFLEYGQYLLLFEWGSVVIFCKNTKQLLCLSKEFSKLKSNFIVDDTLFLFGEKAGSFHFKVVYLPTKKDITERFTPYFSRLINNKSIVWDLKLKCQDGKSFLNVIFENEESEPGNFYSLKIFNKEISAPLKLESSPLDLPPQEELSRTTPSERLSSVGNTSSHPSGIPVKTQNVKVAAKENKPSPTATNFKVRASFCVPHKLMTFAGIILSFGTAIGTVTLMILHPGMVIYQGSGVILTLPAVLTLGIGGSVALTVLAIGSIRWYQAHKRSSR